MNYKKISWAVLAVFVLTLCAFQFISEKEVDNRVNNMTIPHRQLGNTGLSLSEVGLGCGPFEDKTAEESRVFMDVALSNGINYLDIYTPDPKVRDNIGYALQGRRDKIIIQGQIGSYWENGQYKRTRDLAETKAGFEDLLNRLHTNYIDVGMIHIVDTHEDWVAIKDSPFMQYVLELKKKGIIKHIGMSSHNVEVATEAVKSGLIEVLMFSINPAFDMLPADANIFSSSNDFAGLNNINPERAKLYETCQSMGVGIVVMKTFGSGRLLEASQSPFKIALTPSQCLQYALDRPAVACALTGANNEKELLSDLHYFSATEQEKNYAEAFKNAKQASWKGSCMYCHHCSPCPMGIDIAEVTKLLNAAKSSDTIPANVQAQYHALKHKAGECVGCGACETRCPFSVSVRQNMKEAKRLFGE